MVSHHYDCNSLLTMMGFPGSSAGKESACNAGDAGNTGSIPGSGRSPGGGQGNPLQHSCLENPMNREAWWATVHRGAESDMTAACTQTKAEVRRNAPLCMVNALCT